MARPVLHLLGAGRAGRAIARRLADKALVRPGLVVNRSRRSAEEAVRFIGGGRAAGALDERISGGWLMVGLPDGVLEGSLASLVPEGSVPKLSFHLSGSIDAEVLRVFGAPAAAVHPVRAFADPASASERFEGTWCVAEGDALALGELQSVFVAAGGRWLEFDAEDKAAWHAATVAASNFLVTIQGLARDLARRAGLPEESAARILCDLQQGTLETLRERPPTDALTGPIERADESACRRLEAAVSGLESGQARLFRELASATLSLAQEKRGRRESDDALRELFGRRER